MTSTPFSLHCTICYEAFDPLERPPVILPCGHTYLCEPCSQRLKTCMECRTPLFTTTVAPKVSPSGVSSRYSPSYRHQTMRNSPPAAGRRSMSPPPKVPAPEQVRLPIPKNLVLLSMLEAAKLTGVEPSVEEEDKGYESGDDDEQVLAGIQLVSSAYGTYVVRERNGLVVFPEPPNRTLNDEKENQNETDDKENWDEGELLLSGARVQSSHDEHEIEIQPQQLTPSLKTEGLVPLECISSSTMEEDKSSNVASAFRIVPPRSEETDTTTRLCYGQTVQVVDFEQGVAKLARGQGYLEATESQLVKIGDPKDDACTLEGLLSQVTDQKQILLDRLSMIEKTESDLAKQLHQALQIEPEDPFAMALNIDDLDTAPCTPGPPPMEELKYSDSSPTETSQKDTEGLDVPILAPESHDFDDFVLAATYHGDGDYSHDFNSGNGMLPSLMCTELLPAFLGDGEHRRSRMPPSSRMTLNRVPSPTQQNRSPTSGVNFRTGMSGHLALASSTSHADRSMNSLPRRSNMRLMSSTNGAGHNRRRRAASAESPDLSTPTW